MNDKQIVIDHVTKLFQNKKVLNISHLTLNRSEVDFNHR